MALEVIRCGESSNAWKKKVWREDGVRVSVGGTERHCGLSCLIEAFDYC